MKTYYFENGFQVVLDFEKGIVKSIQAAGEEFVTGEIPFYAVKMRKEDGSSRIITGEEGTFLSYQNNSACYSHPEMEVCVTVEQNENSLHWHISVKNKTKDLIEWAELMSTGVFGKLRDEEGGKGEIIFPYNEGCVVTDMDKRNWSPFTYLEPEYPSLGKYAIFPNMISSQFLAYIANGKGIYLGMHDKERTTKHIDFRTVEDSIKLQMRAFCDVDYGEAYEMPFDCVMTFFEGDWYDACDIYRNWFYDNLPEGLKKIAETDNLPEWYEESPIIVTYPVRGKFDTDKMEPNKLYPYKNAIPYLKEIADKTQSKVMSLLMHWEGTAPWAPPYMWPPYGGEQQFQEYKKELHERDMLLGLYCSGMGWTQQSNLIAEYNRQKEFETEDYRKLMSSDSDGSIKSVICTEQRTGYDMCPACEETRKIMTTEFQRVLDSGVDYLQVFDQNHGGNSYFCYSKEHGHTPAPGKWQVRETKKILDDISRENVLLGCESAAAEPFISALKFSDNRYELNYYIGLPIPMYSYIYHEYVNNFMGNQICMMLSKEEYNYPYRVAYSFLAGDMLTVVLTEEGEVSYCWGNDCFKDHTDKEQAYKILKNLNGWRQGAGKKFLHLGKMVKPVKLNCGQNSFMGEDGRKIMVDKVLTQAYNYEGEQMQFAVNYNSTPVIVSTEVPVTVYQSGELAEVSVTADQSGEMAETPVTVYQSGEMTEEKKVVYQFEIPALSAVAIKRKA